MKIGLIAALALILCVLWGGFPVVFAIGITVLLCVRYLNGDNNDNLVHNPRE